MSKTKVLLNASIVETPYAVVQIKSIPMSFAGMPFIIRRKTETHRAIRDIDLVLKKNRKILKELPGDKDYKLISKDKLENKG
ncbi:MAG: hypothetical protein JWN76_1591 [Chitinophagaceae bacterium]|nr:hypothetical protein [Chitinophagaceae bacterium]